MESSFSFLLVPSNYDNEKGLAFQGWTFGEDAIGPLEALLVMAPEALELGFSFSNGLALTAREFMLKAYPVCKGPSPPFKSVFDTISFGILMACLLACLLAC